MAIALICQDPSLALVRKAVDELPEDLTRIYERLLEKINEGRTGTERLKLANHIINFFLAAFTSLPVCEFIPVVPAGYQKFEIEVASEFILTCCRHLVALNSSTDRFEFRHISVTQIFQESQCHSYNRILVNYLIA